MPSWDILLHVLSSWKFRSWKEIPTSSGAILLAFKLFTVGCQILKHIPTTHKASDNLLMIWMGRQHSSVWSKNGIGHHQTIKWLVIKPPMRVGFSTDRPTLCQFMDGFAQLVYWQKERESSGLMVGMFFFTAAALGPHTIPAALCTMPLGPSPLEVLW